MVEGGRIQLPSPQQENAHNASSHHFLTKINEISSWVIVVMTVLWASLSLDRPISSYSRFTLMYQAALVTENPQGCLPYQVHRAWKLQYETGRWEQRPFSPAKIETFEGPYLQRMEMRGRQLQPLEFWFGFEQRRPGVNLAHMCLKTSSKTCPPDKSSLTLS